MGFKEFGPRIGQTPDPVLVESYAFLFAFHAALTDLLILALVPAAM